MTTIWFTSDLHLDHVRISELAGRPFLDAAGNPDVHWMNETLITRWVERVHPDDTVYILGDVVMGQRERSLPLLNRLTGHKTLVQGNHDYCSAWLWKNNPEKARRWAEAYAPYFDAIEDHLTFTFPDGTVVNLHHFPYTGDSHGKDRYSDQRLVDDGTPLLCGHVHDAWKRKLTPQGTPMLNVGVDQHGFGPISADVAFALLKGLGT